MCFEKFFPGLGFDKERTEEFKASQDRERSAQGVECIVIDLTAIIEVERSEVGVEVCKCLEGVWG